MSSVRRRTWKNKDGSKTTIWNVDYVDNTRQRVVKGGFKTKAEAERYLHEIRKELERSEIFDLGYNEIVDFAGQRIRKKTRKR